MFYVHQVTDIYVYFVMATAMGGFYARGLSPKICIYSGDACYKAEGTTAVGKDLITQASNRTVGPPPDRTRLVKLTSNNGTDKQWHTFPKQLQTFPIQRDQDHEHRVQQICQYDSCLTVHPYSNQNVIHDIITRDAKSVSWVEIWEFWKSQRDIIDAITITKMIVFDIITQTPVSGSCCLPLGALQSMWATWCKI